MSGGAKQPFDLDAHELPVAPPTATENERLLACLGYVSQIIVPLVLPILLLVNRTTRQSGFVRHHAVQAVALVAVGIVYGLLVVFLLLLLRTNESWAVLGLGLLILPPVCVLLVFGIQSLRGLWIEVPLITNLLKDLRLL
ncbi:MAG: hypothetical protein ABFD20_00085 [Anaerolineales bacterium]